MANVILKKSEDANINYLAIISKVSALKPIENADKLCTTVLNGYDIIVQKTTQIGDIVVFFPMETAICEKFLSVNNQYGISDYEKNANAEEVKALMDAAMDETDADKAKELMDTAKSRVGFFNKYGRVTMLKLRGVYSCGFVMPIESMEKAYPELIGTDWETLVGTEFNMVGNEEFCKKFVPRIKKHEKHTSERGSRQHRRFQKRMTKFDRIIPENFSRHYETENIEKVIKEIRPTDTITVTVKLHGTSGIFSNIECNRKLSKWEKIKKFFGFKVQTTEYGNVYASRNVIKNQYINKEVTSGFYKKDAWAPVNEMLKPHIVPGMTIYGEIVGYVEGTEKPIQVKHDYGCNVGEWKFLPYRISTVLGDGRKYEWNVAEVDEWTRHLVSMHPEYANRIIFFETLYHGKFADLYPDLNPESETWYDDVLYRMKNEKKWHMEEKEPLCHRLDIPIAEKEAELAKAKKGSAKYKKLEKELKNLIDDQAPREGVVIRIDNDVFPRAYKLKTNAHRFREKVAHDAGEVDMEEMESSSDN
jgi:hypothetical protein